MWQEVAIVLIGIITALYLGLKIYHFIVHSSKANNPCAGCCGCSLNENVKKKNSACCKEIKEP